jgi:hypothetical protein
MTERMDREGSLTQHSQKLTELLIRDLAITGAPPADRNKPLFHPSFIDEPFSEQRVQRATEFVQMRDDTIKALQQSLDLYLSQQSLLYAQQLQQKAPESHVWESGTTSGMLTSSGRTSYDTLYTASTTSPRESMPTLSEPDDDIFGDTLLPCRPVPCTANRLVTPPPGLEHLMPQVTGETSKASTGKALSLSYAAAQTGTSMQHKFRSL